LTDIISIECFLLSLVTTKWDICTYTLLCIALTAPMYSYTSHVRVVAREACRRTMWFSKELETRWIIYWMVIFVPPRIIFKLRPRRLSMTFVVKIARTFQPPTTNQYSRLDALNKLRNKLQLHISPFASGTDNKN